ncbi:MAG: ABC transporter ATP-binding protein [Solirubrobacterales bacterium]
MSGGGGFIEVDGLTVSYDGEHLALGGVDMSVGEGDFVAVLGPSGCGKSTLLQVLSGLVRPVSGRATIAGADVTNGSVSKRPRVGYVFQDHRLLPWRTVAQNLELVLASAGVPKDEWEGRVERFLEMLQIAPHRDAWPMRLSGGQRQRVSIARALAIDPAVILMDEPFSTLDEVTGRLMRQQLVELWQQQRRAIVFVTHSIREAVYLADRIVILTRGPATVLETLEVGIPRPRQYEDPRLTELESEIVDRVMEVWGYDDGGAAAPEPDSSPERA